MKFQIDHDYHIHSHLSLCSDDPEQTAARILAYGRENGLRRLCLTDHYWDERIPGMEEFFFYRDQDTARVRSALPLPQADDCELLFGCETDMSYDLRIGITRERCEEFDFILVPTSHMHLTPYTYYADRTDVAERARDYVRRLEAFVRADLPFHKVGLAHMTCSLIYKEQNRYLDVLDAIPDSDWADILGECARLGCGIELNMGIGTFADEKLCERVLRPYHIAREKGCRFYLGSDAHHPAGLDSAMKRFVLMTESLGLCEEHKFHIEKSK